MSVFCVFGVTKDLAQKESNKGNIQKDVMDTFNKLKPKQCSPAFDAPQFCFEWIELANKTTLCRDLRMMMYAQKEDANGIVKTTKKGSVMRSWVTFNEDIL